MKKLGSSLLLLALCSLSFAALAQDSDAVPQNALAGMHVIHANNSANAHKQGNIPTPHGFMSLKN